MRVTKVSKVSDKGGNGSTKDKAEPIYLEALSKKELIDLTVDIYKRPSDYLLEIVEVIESDRPDPGDLVTIPEYLDMYGYSLEKPAAHRLFNLVAQAYVKRHGIKPRKIARKDDRGIFGNKVYAYDDPDFDLIEEALKRVPHQKKPR